MTNHIENMEDTIENMEDTIESLQNDLKKAKAELKFSKFLSEFEEFIPDPKASSEYNSFRHKFYRETTPNRFVQFFLTKRQFFISELPFYRYGPDNSKISTITIPVDKKTNEFLKDLRDVLEKHKDTLGPITIHSPK